ncbi:MAG TPA: toprim domain-containing protein, partial [Bacilli bacterium]|nr:toprim domain-containing protein [Bacilli bacterium]
LYRALTEKSNPYLPLNLLEVGLIKTGRDDKYYDMFRSRIMFPIDDLNGNIVGFSGRTYHKTSKDEAKYVNSNENIIFKKSNILYNYSRAINTIKQKDHVFIFEGFLDVIAAYRAKVENTIATMGTALTNQQIIAIKKTTMNITLCFDGDNPGIEATKRAIDLFNRANFNIKVMLLPENLDPDEYANKFGTESLNDFLENKALSAPEYLYELEKRNLNINDPYSIESFKKNVFNFLRLFNTSSLTEFYIKKTAADLEMATSSLKDDYKKGQQKQTISAPRSREAGRRPAATKKRYIANEKCAIYHAYFSKDSCTLISSEKTNFTYADPDNRNILFKLFDFYKTNDKVNDDFVNLLTAEEKQILTKILQKINSDNLISLEECLQVNIEFFNEKIQEKLRESFKDDEIDDKKAMEFINSKRITTKIVKKEE